MERAGRGALWNSGDRTRSGRKRPGLARPEVRAVGPRASGASGSDVARRRTAIDGVERRRRRPHATRTHGHDEEAYEPGHTGGLAHDHHRKPAPLARWILRK